MTETLSCQKKLAPCGTPLKIRLVALNARYIHSCLALFYIRQELASHLPEAEVEILQLTINDNSYERLLRITADSPFAVFFSAAIWNSEAVAQLVGDVRACLPECRVVVGGPEAGVLRQKLPAGLCSVVQGEIEAVGPQFYQDLRTGSLQPWYQGSFLKLAEKKLPSPYRDDDFTGELQNRHIYYESSRGCPYSCSYCLSATERGLFQKELAQVYAELRQMLRHNPRVVRFVDRTFNAQPDRALAIWKFILQQQCQTLFHFEIAPERFTEEMFSFLQTIGPDRFQFEIGIQSTNPATLAAINRRMDIEGVHPIIARLAALGTIHLHVDLILGLPHETAESFGNSFRRVFAMGAHYIQMGLLKILPETPICHGAGEFGYIHSSHPPYAVFANNWLSHTEMGELYWFCECVEKFHNTRYFVSLWSYLRVRGEDIFDFFNLLLAEGHKVGFLHRAATQELLSAIVMRVCCKRADASLIRDLLRYDWLRCGFRKLPGCLAPSEGEEAPETSKEVLYRLLPEDLPGVYSSSGRNQMFKRSVFLRLSAETASVLEFGSGRRDVRIAVLPERQGTLHEHHKVVLLGEVVDG